jgi:hypothetical protein
MCCGRRRFARLDGGGEIEPIDVDQALAWKR